MTVYSTPTNITTLSSAMTYVNNTSGGAFGIMVLIAFFSILFLAMRNTLGGYPGVNAKIFLASSFLTTIVSIMMFMIGVVNDLTMYVCIFVTALAIFSNVIGGRD